MSEPAFDLVLLPGMGADARLFGPQQEAFEHLVVPPWIEPQRRESLPHYAGRMAELVRPTRPLILGGVSLGGMVAWEMAASLRPAAIVLIATCRTRRGIRPLYRLCGPLLHVVPPTAIEATKRIAPLVAGRLAMAGDFRPLALDMFLRSDSRFVRWALEAILDWHPRPADATPTFHLHGARDHVIPCRRVEADRIVPGAGHLVNLTHAGVVNEFLGEVAGGIDE